MGPGMGAVVDTGVASHLVRVPLGRRVEVISDLLVPPDPTDSSRATCRDIAQRLEEWEGPGIVVVCGRLVAPECAGGAGPVGALAAHPVLGAALAAFASRANSSVLAVLGPDERDTDLVGALERCGVIVHAAVDLACETGAGTRTVLVRSGTFAGDVNPPAEITPQETTGRG